MGDKFHLVKTSGTAAKQNLTESFVFWDIKLKFGTQLLATLSLILNSFMKIFISKYVNTSISGQICSELAIVI